MSDHQAPFTIRPTGESSFAADVFKSSFFSRGKYIFFFESYSGEVRYDSDSPENSAVSLTLETASVVCRDPAIKPEKRREIVAMMKNQLLACESNGHVTFTSTRIQRKEGNRYVVEGSLGFRGTKKSASIELTLIKLGADRLEVDGSAQLKLSDFGVTPPSGVKDEVQVRILLWPERAQMRRAAS